jgi:drug/metabolite transporter (DMT)-like permease
LRLRISSLDGWLLLVTLIWGSNFTIVKKSLLEIPPSGFNLLRLVLASAVLLALLPRLPQRVVQDGEGPVRRPAPGRVEGLTRHDWQTLVGLAIVGHCLYQILFMYGLPRTSVANTSLVFGCTPITVALMSAALGHERVPLTRWMGVALSAVGIYLVVGGGGSLTSESLRGDLAIFGAMLCWAAYTVASKPLLARHAPITITSLSMAIGTIMYAPVGAADLIGLDWRGVSPGAWSGVVVSSLLALVVAYLIWYTAVQRIGTTRTAIYSNMVPLVAMAVAAIWLDEPLTAIKIVGAGAVIAGVAITKVEAGGRKEG